MTYKKNTGGHPVASAVLEKTGVSSSSYLDVDNDGSDSGDRAARMSSTSFKLQQAGSVAKLMSKNEDVRGSRF